MQIDRFPRAHFESHQAYYELHTSIAFYERYEKYQYILTHQLDAFVFSDELMTWCKRDYDFVGAPWFENFGVTECKRLWAVGNSGFCLRKVKSFIRALREKPDEIPIGPDDVFFGIKAPKLFDWFRVPKPFEAVPFSFEASPVYLYYLNESLLPFGCHAWHKFGFNFWKPIIESYGHNIEKSW